MDPELVLQKFGDYYTADENTYKMGIDLRITSRLAKRFANKNVLETCTGAGFSTISLAREAAHVTTIDISQNHQAQAIDNIVKAGLNNKVTFICGSCLDWNLLTSIENIDAAFIDPDWADSEANHLYKFKNSNTRPADLVLETILDITPNAALILPPFISGDELDHLGNFEVEKIYLDDKLALYCIYTGCLISHPGETRLMA